MEIWKDIEGFEGLYQVSNMGNVKSLARKYKNGITNKQDIVLKQSTNPKGYKSVYLCKDSKVYAKNVHRLVCVNFLDNPENKSDVNHKNGIKSDNSLINLEWVTRSENIKHAYDNSLRRYTENQKNTFLVNKVNNSKKVICVETGIIYDSLKIASNKIGVKYITLHAQITGRNANKYNLKYL